eukprot:8089866-Alexandrium_andersonii.AAC.1
MNTPSHPPFILQGGSRSNPSPVATIAPSAAPLLFGEGGVNGSKPSQPDRRHLQGGTGVGTLAPREWVRALVCP